MFFFSSAFHKAPLIVNASLGGGGCGGGGGGSYSFLYPALLVVLLWLIFLTSLFDIVTEQELLHTSLKSEVNRANRGAAAVHGESGDTESFLSLSVGENIQLRNVGSFLLKTGVK